MFTGIVEKLGTVISTSHLRGKTYCMRIDLGKMSKTARIGDSIAINGVCLTVTGKRGTVASFDVISETLKRTDLGTRVPGSKVNIERSMRIEDRISGHFVSGHIDGTGRISRVTTQKDGSIKMWITVPRKLTTMMVEKGSVALDGISLTLVDVTEQQISVCLIPHTLKITTLGFKKESDLVNIEADLVGKYVLKLASSYRNQLKK